MTAADRTGASLPAESLAHLLRRRAAARPTQELLRFGERSLTCAEVEDCAGRLANVLRAQGVAHGDRVGVMLPNGVDFPVAWLAIATLGAVMVPLNVQYLARELAYTLGDSGASCVLVDPSLAAPLREAATSLPELRTVLEVPPGSATGRGDGALAAAVRAAPATASLDGVSSGDLLNIQYTSGTTGAPKGCMLTHEYWLRLAVRSAEFARLSADDVVLTAQPFYYMDPQWNVAMCLLAGCPLVILPRFSASTFWASVKATGTTFFYVLGTMPVFLLKQPPDPAVERGHRVRFVGCSGIVPQLHAEFEARWGVPWREAFGMTETGVDLAVPVEETDCVGSGTVGRPVPGKEARIVGPDGSVLGDGVVGELCVRGSGMMLGYWNNPAATSERLRDGWLHTGDLAVRDARGNYRIVGRLKEMIRRTGENISAAEVEGVLAQHPAVRGAAVVPVPDPLRGEEVKAFIQLQPGFDDIDPASIIDFTRANLAAFKVPRFVEFVRELPRTPSEKVAKHELLSRKADQRAGAWDATTGAWG